MNRSAQLLSIPTLVVLGIALIYSQGTMARPGGGGAGGIGVGQQNAAIGASFKALRAVSNQNIPRARRLITQAIQTVRGLGVPGVVRNLRKARQSLAAAVGPRNKVLLASDYLTEAIQAVIESKNTNQLNRKQKLQKAIQHIRLGKLSAIVGFNGSGGASLIHAIVLLRSFRPAQRPHTPLGKALRKVRQAKRAATDEYMDSLSKQQEVVALTTQAIQFIRRSAVFNVGGGGLGGGLF